MNFMDFLRFVRARADLKIHQESGQTMTEYIFLIVLVALVCIPLVELLPRAVLGYVRPFYYCLSRPIP